MYQFEYVPISSEKSTQENIRIIKSYLDDMADKLNMLSQQIEDDKKGVKKYVKTQTKWRWNDKKSWKDMGR